MIPDLVQARREIFLTEAKAGLSWPDFELPSELEAGEPPEARGLERDQVRLMVSHYRDDAILNTCFRDLPEHMAPGDVLVINTSGTLPSALPARRSDGQELIIHLSTRLPGDLWILELRQPSPKSRLIAGSEPFFQGQPGEEFHLPEGGWARLLIPYDPALRRRQERPASVRLWLAELELPSLTIEFLERNGFPIRYSYVRQNWEIDAYQTVYATEPGSAEMPSAGRAFTPELITRLVSHGVTVVPLLLHTGVASLEAHEKPHEEYYRVPAGTAQAVNAARDQGKRVIAVGTTSVRALETVADEDGIVHPGEGWTRLVITPERGLRVVDALLTGFHEPRSSHLWMLSALAGEQHVQQVYAAALAGGYLWHEFGDLHLLLP